MLKEMDIPLSSSQMGTISEEEYFNAIDSMADAALEDTLLRGEDNACRLRAAGVLFGIRRREVKDATGGLFGAA